MYKSQYGQDKYLNDNIFKNKTCGAFVDIGAHNGISLSNTYFFEKSLNWSGICIEPNFKLFTDLSNNRNSININGCAWYKDEIKKFRLIDGYSEMLSGLVDSYDSKHLSRIDRECLEKNGHYTDIDIPCYELNSLLEKHEIFNIDLLSIDTEGSEFDILKSIDFNRFNIGVIVVENNYKDNNIFEFLTENDYTLLDRIKIDEIYLKRDYLLVS